LNAIQEQQKKCFGASSAGCYQNGGLEIGNPPLGTPSQHTTIPNEKSKGGVAIP
jgi:hypothetical protein